MSDADTTAWRQRAERCDDRVRELRAELARRDEQIAAIGRLMADVRPMVLLQDLRRALDALDGGAS